MKSLVPITAILTDASKYKIKQIKDFWVEIKEYLANNYLQIL